MAERKESSVLFSLRELRGIENDRLAEEEDARRQAEEDRIRAQMEAEQRARDEEQARVQAQQDAERRAREEAEQRAREERMRLEDAERQARVQANAQLEQERFAREMEIRAIENRKKRPVALIAAAGFLVLIVAVLGVVLWVNHQDQLEKERIYKAELAALSEEIKDKEGEIDRLIGEKDERYQVLLAAKTAEDKRRAKEKLAETQRQLARQRKALAELREQEAEKRRRREKAEARAKEERKKVKVKCDPNDPLCGL